MGGSTACFDPYTPWLFREHSDPSSMRAWTEVAPRHSIGVGWGRGGVGIVMSLFKILRVPARPITTEQGDHQHAYCRTDPRLG